MGPGPGRGRTGRPSVPIVPGWEWCSEDSRKAQVAGANRVPDDQENVSSGRGRRRQTGDGKVFAERFSTRRECRQDTEQAEDRGRERSHRPRVQITGRDRVADQPAEAHGQKQAAGSVQRHPQQAPPIASVANSHVPAQRDPCRREPVHDGHHHTGNQHQNRVAHGDSPWKIARRSKRALWIPAKLLEENEPEIEIATAEAKRNCQQDRRSR